MTPILRLFEASVRAVALGLVVLCGATAAAQAVSVQNPTPAQPGSFSGTAATAIFGAADLSSGLFSLPSPFQAPTDRGPLLANVFPTYSPGAGLSDWGIGWGVQLAITRFRDVGTIDYSNNDNFTSPWGELRQGADGAWYPIGLQPAVKVTFQSDGTVQAVQADGTVFRFGELTAGVANVISTGAGIHSWLLTSAADPLGHQTLITWNPLIGSAKPYVTQVQYGGHGSSYQYQISLQRSQYISIPFLDYSSGVGLTMPPLVTRVAVQTRNATTGQFDNDWFYDLTYTLDPTDPRGEIYLTSVAQSMSSDSQPTVALPPITFTYDYPSQALDAGLWLVADSVDNAVSEVAQGSATVTPEVTPFDQDNDGFMDFEINGVNAPADQYALFHNLGTAGGFVEEQLPPPTPQNDPLCRPSGGGQPRTLVQLARGDTDYEVFALSPSESTDASTVIHICQRDGTLLTRLSIPIAFTNGVQLVDMNADGQPDIIGNANGSIAIAINTSNPGSYGFAPPKTFTMCDPSGTWCPQAQTTIYAADFNGDGITDVGWVVYSPSVLLIYFLGGPGLAFSPGSSLDIPTDWPFQDTNVVTFLDVNGDGLADLVATGSVQVNNQLYPQDYVALSGLGTFDVPRYLGPAGLSFGDLTSSGQPEAFWQQPMLPQQDFVEFTALPLLVPGAGLLAFVDDGRGNKTSYSYKTGPGGPQVRQRGVVLASTTLSSTGEDDYQRWYTFAGPQVQPSSGHLVGYNLVTSFDLLGSDQASFLSDDNVQGLLLQTLHTDITNYNGGFATGSRYQYDLVQPAATNSGLPAAGVPFYRPASRVDYHLAGSATINDRTTQFVSYADAAGGFSSIGRCLSDVVSTLADGGGSLETTTSYQKVGGLGDGLYCLTSTVTETGTHPDSSLDFSQVTKIDRNGIGLPVATHSIAADEDLVTLTLTYDPSSNLVLTSTSPGHGTYTYAYDAQGLPAQVADPVGVVTAVTREPVTDQILTLSTTRGPDPYIQTYTYDSRRRVVSSADNFNGASSVVKTYEYGDATPTSLAYLRERTSPSPTSTRDVLHFGSARGSALADAAATSTGWIFGGVVQRHVGTMTTGTVPNVPLALMETEYGAMSPSMLANGFQELGTAGINSVGMTIATHQTLQSSPSVSRTTSTVTDPVADTLVTTVTENGQFTRSNIYRGGRLAESVDETGVAYKYTYDALGRLRAIAFPDNTTQTMSYDAHGRASGTSRGGIESVQYAYQGATGLLAAKSFTSADSQLERTESYTYDAFGRVTGRADYDPGSGNSRAFQYVYDGPDGFGRVGRNERGQLTSVTGDQFVRGWSHEIDGSPGCQTTQVQVPDGDSANPGITVGTCVQYYNDKTQQAIYTQPFVAPAVETVRANELDAFGRVTDLLISAPGGPVAPAQGKRDEVPRIDLVYAYAPEGEIQSVSFPDGGQVSFTYDALTRRRTGTSNHAGTHTYSNSSLLNGRGQIQGENFGIDGALVARSYTYTPNRLLSGSVDTQHSSQYGYSPFGMPQSETLDGQQELIVHTPSLFVTLGANGLYDSFGRVSRRNGVSFTYGPDSQVSTATLGATTWGFTYDDRGNRVLKSVASPTGRTLVAAYLPEGYVDGSGLTQSVSVAGSVVGLIRPNGTFGQIGTDARGTSVASSDGSALLAGPFGDRPTHPDVAPIVDFAGGAFDPDLGLIRMGVRDYDPKMNQFTTPDPFVLESPGTVLGGSVVGNLYSYAGDDPVNNADPSGQRPCVPMEMASGYGESGHQCGGGGGGNWGGGGGDSSSDDDDSTDDDTDDNDVGTAENNVPGAATSAATGTQAAPASSETGALDPTSDPNESLPAVGNQAASQPLSQTMTQIANQPASSPTGDAEADAIIAAWGGAADTIYVGTGNARDVPGLPGLGIGIEGTIESEGGLWLGASGQGSYGVGMFFSERGMSVGSFFSVGFLSPQGGFPSGNNGRVVGQSRGGGASIFVTNAGEVSGLYGAFSAWNINVGEGPYQFSFQAASAAGTFMFSLSPAGWGFQWGLSVSHYDTWTW